MRHVINERLNENLRGLTPKNLDLTYEATKFSFFQNRPWFGETQIEQACLLSVAESA